MDGQLFNITYDLNEFAVTSNVYVVSDLDYRHNHTYYVGIPDPIIQQIPIQCRNIIQPCNTNDIVNGTCNRIIFATNYGFIFQINQDTQQCLNLGTRVRWELYDTLNPARGVTGVYYDGSWCSKGGITHILNIYINICKMLLKKGKNMELRIHLVCPRDQDAVFHPRNETKIDLFEYVEEDDDTQCSYSFTHESAIACPYQCIGEEIYDNVDTFTVCNQKGICAADPNAAFVRCLCDTGYTGIDCTQLATHDPTINPTIDPTNIPTVYPTLQPTQTPTDQPIKSVVKEKEGSQDKDGGFKILWIVLIILCVLLVVAISYVIYKNRKQKAQLQRIDSVDINRDIDSNQAETPEIDGEDTDERATLR